MCVLTKFQEKHRPTEYRKNKQITHDGNLYGIKYAIYALNIAIMYFSFHTAGE